MFGAVFMVFLLLYGINGCLFLVSSHSLETKNTVYQSKQRIVPASSYVYAGMNLGSALSV